MRVIAVDDSPEGCLKALDSVADGAGNVVVLRPGGRTPVVMVSFHEYRRLVDAMYLLRVSDLDRRAAPAGVGDVDRRVRRSRDGTVGRTSG